MSTRIYNGFRFEPGDITSALQCIDEFRPVLRRLEESHVRRLMAWQAIRRVDRSYMKEHFGLPMPKDAVEGASAISDAWQFIMRMKEEARKSERVTLLDTKFELWIFPHPEKTLGIFSTSIRDWGQRWLRTCGVKPYAYWDNTDRPDGISERAWSMRGQEWNDRLGPRGIPSDRCLTVELSDPHVGLIQGFTKSVAKSAISLSYTCHDRRVTDAAVDLIVHRTGTNMLQAKKSPEWETTVEEVRNILPSVISLEDLRLKKADKMPEISL